MKHFEWRLPLRAFAAVLGLAASGCSSAVPPARQVGPGSASSGTVAADPAQGTASAPPAVEGRAAEDALPSGRSGAATPAPPPLPGARGRLPAEAIVPTIRNSRRDFQRCYEQGLARNPKLQGRVTVRFTIGLDGKVSSVANISNPESALADPDVVSCILEVCGRWSFPQPEGGTVTLVFPVSFTSEE